MSSTKSFFSTDQQSWSLLVSRIALGAVLLPHGMQETKSQEPRAKSQEQRTKSQEQRTKNKDKMQDVNYLQNLKAVVYNSILINIESTSGLSLNK